MGDKVPGSITEHGEPKTVCRRAGICCPSPDISLHRIDARLSRNCRRSSLLSSPSLLHSFYTYIIALFLSRVKPGGQVLCNEKAAPCKGDGFPKK